MLHAYATYSLYIYMASFILYWCVVLICTYTIHACLLCAVYIYAGEEEARLRSYKDIMIPANMVSNKDIEGSIDDTAAKDYEGDFM